MYCLGALGGDSVRSKITSLLTLALQPEPHGVLAMVLGLWFKGMGVSVYKSAEYQASCFTKAIYLKSLTIKTLSWSVYTFRHTSIPLVLLTLDLVCHSGRFSSGSSFSHR